MYAATFETNSAYRRSLSAPLAPRPLALVYTIFISFGIIAGSSSHCSLWPLIGTL